MCRLRVAARPVYFFAKVIDGGTSGSKGDMIAVLANSDMQGQDNLDGTTNVGDFPMSSDNAGVVTGGNLVVH